MAKKKKPFTSAERTQMSQNLKSLEEPAIPTGFIDPKNQKNNQPSWDDIDLTYMAFEELKIKLPKLTTQIDELLVNLDEQRVDSWDSFQNRADADWKARKAEYVPKFMKTHAREIEEHTARIKSMCVKKIAQNRRMKHLLEFLKKLSDRHLKKSICDEEIHKVENQHFNLSYYRSNVEEMVLESYRGEAEWLSTKVSQEYTRFEFLKKKIIKKLKNRGRDLDDSEIESQSHDILLKMISERSSTTGLVKAQSFVWNHSVLEVSPDGSSQNVQGNASIVKNRTKFRASKMAGYTEFDPEEHQIDNSPNDVDMIKFEDLFDDQVSKLMTLSLKDIEQIIKVYNKEISKTKGRNKTGRSNYKREAEKAFASLQEFLKNYPKRSA